MYHIKLIETGDTFAVSDYPKWSAGTWECGDARFLDESGDKFQPVESEPVPTPGDMRVTRLAFLQRFTLAERMAARAARATDPIVDDFMDMVDAATFIDLSREDTEQGVGYLVTKGHVTAERAASILTAPVQPIERPQGL